MRPSYRDDLRNEMERLSKVIDELSTELGKTKSNEHSNTRKSGVASLTAAIKDNANLGHVLMGIGISICLSVFSFPIPKAEGLYVMGIGSLTALGGTLIAVSSILFRQSYEKNPMLLRKLEEIGLARFPFDKKWWEQYRAGTVCSRYRTALKVECLAFALLMAAVFTGLLLIVKLLH